MPPSGPEPSRHGEHGSAANRVSRWGRLVPGVLGCLGPGELRLGTGRAERPGRSPRGVRGHAPAGVAGQGGSRRFWVTHWEPSSGYIESRGGEVPPERDRTVPGGTQPDSPSGCLDPGAEFKPPLRWASPCLPAVPRARDRAGGVNRDSGPHARGLSRPPVHDHTPYPRRAGRGARVRDQPTGHRPGLIGGGCPPSRSRHGTCAVCPDVACSDP